MIVSNSGKLVYLRVPRTGSTSLANFLIEHLAFSQERDFHTPVPYNRIPGLNMADASLVHATLAEILASGMLEYPLEEYRVFGVIRDPVDRFLSSAWHACRHQGVEAKDNDEAVAFAWPLADPQAPIFRPQSDWLLHGGKPINRIFAYPDLDRLAQEILGSNQIRVTFRHRSESRKIRSNALDDAWRQRILALYRDDQQLWERIVANAA